MHKTLQHTESNQVLIRWKSFRFLGTWTENQEYKNDTSIQDFVEWGGILWGCIENNINEMPGKCNRFWKIALKGIAGKNGKEIVSIHEIDYKDDDQYCYITIKVVYSDLTDDSFELKIAKMKGDPGSTPTVKTVNDIKYWAIDNELIKDEYGNPIKAEGLPGKDGSVVTIGEDGYWYIDGVKTDTAASFQGVIQNEITKNSSNPVTSDAIYNALIWK